VKTGVTIPPGPPQAQSTAHHAIRRLLGRSTAPEGVLLFILVALGLVLARQSYAQSAIKVASGVSYTVAVEGLAGPRGLLFALSGDLYVVEQASGEIAKIAPDGRVTRIAKGFSNAHDIAMDAEGNLYVAETGAGRVARISPTGEVTTYVDGLSVPVDLDFNPQGELLVCELGSGKVMAFTSPEKGRVFARFGAHGLAFGKSGVTFVNDYAGSRIVKVGLDGRVETIAGGVVGPVGLALGRSGDLYVAQRKLSKLSRIKLDGTRIILMDGLNAPRDPAFDAAGNLFVAETGAGRILKLTGDF